MKDILNNISELVNKYESGEWVSVDNLRVILRELSSGYYYLTKFNIESARQWNMEVYNFKGSDAAGQRFADLKVPELRHTRKILTAVSKVLDSIRSEIAIIRTES